MLAACSGFAGPCVEPNGSLASANSIAESETGPSNINHQYGELIAVSLLIVMTSLVVVGCVTHIVMFGITPGRGNLSLKVLFTVAVPLFSPPMQIPFGQFCAGGAAGLALGPSEGLASLCDGCFNGFAG